MSTNTNEVAENKAKVEISGLMRKYFTAVNARNRLFLRRAFSALANRSLSKRREEAFLRRKNLEAKTKAFERWRQAKNHRRILTNFLHVKALEKVRMMIREWRRCSAACRISRGLIEKFTRQTFARYFDLLRFAYMQRRTTIARFQWRLQGQCLLRYFLKLRDFTKKRRQLSMKLRLFGLSRNAKLLSRTFLDLKQARFASRLVLKDFCDRRRRRGLKRLMNKWRTLIQSKYILQKLLSVARKNRKLKIYRLFIQQLKSALISKLKSTLRNPECSARDGSDDTHGSRNPLREDPENSLGTTGHFENYKQHVWKNVVDYRNQASDIRSALNTLTKSNLPKFPMHSLSSKTISPSVGQPSFHTSSRNLNSFFTVNPHFEGHHTDQLSEGLRSGHLTDTENLLQSKMQLLELKVSTLKIHKTTMTEAQVAQAKADIREQVQQIKQYQASLLQNAK
jgi:hypothetical protein